ncbi:hypothetical protein ACPA9J_09965 [Pseudomonas aeruginosa]
MQTHSTSKGADYGVTSPMTQFQVYRNAIPGARQKLGLFHEVEWVQHVRSYAMTRFAVEHPRLRLGGFRPVERESCYSASRHACRSRRPTSSSAR